MDGSKGKNKNLQTFHLRDLCILSIILLHIKHCTQEISGRGKIWQTIQVTTIGGENLAKSYSQCIC